MTRRPSKREVRRWLEQRDDERERPVEVTITDTVVSSEWEPPADEVEDVPEPGTTVTRHVREPDGTWHSESERLDGREHNHEHNHGHERGPADE